MTIINEEVNEILVFSGDAKWFIRGCEVAQEKPANKGDI